MCYVGPEAWVDVSATYILHDKIKQKWKGKKNKNKKEKGFTNGLWNWSAHQDDIWNWKSINLVYEIRWQINVILPL